MYLHSSHCLYSLEKADTHLHFNCFVLHFNWDIVTASIFSLSFFLTVVLADILLDYVVLLVFFFNLADVFIITIQLEDSQ